MKTLITDADKFLSIVNAFLDQSHEHPSFLSWFMIISPYSFFQSQTFLIKASLPIDCLSIFSLSSFLSTNACVAIPAWSVPGCHKVSKLFIL